MKSTVQAVKLLQYGGNCLPTQFRSVTDHNDFNPGSENVGLLFLQCCLAAGCQPERAGQDQAIPHACSIAVMKAPAASKPVC